jgi:hypothetical protein
MDTQGLFIVAVVVAVLGLLLELKLDRILDQLRTTNESASVHL